MSYEENLAIIAASLEVLSNIHNRCEYKEMGGCEGISEACSAMTQYGWDGNGENPNRDLMMCEYHYKEYKRFWEDQWADYYASVR